MYNQAVLETRSHLLLHFPFALSCWQYICSCIFFVDLAFHLDCISKIKEKVNKPFFMEIIILAAWSIWPTRNFQDKA
jgi:predicted branched-subunit amino acid permease